MKHSENRHHLVFSCSFFLLVCFLFLVSCKKSTSSQCDDTKGLYISSNYPVGVAVNMYELQSDVRYKQIAIEQFNSITPENIFKPSFLHPADTTFNWQEADSLTEFCVKNNKRLHGHTLIWHEQLPMWIIKYKGTSADWDKLMKNHIQTIVKHFKGKVKSWDVVNEAFNDDGTLRNTIWRENLGDNYIEKAFQYAYEADPDALLFYNDYALETISNKRNSALKLLNNLKLRGIKIDGIGLQMHVSTLYPEAPQLAEALRSISDYGYKIHLSEIDISINPLNRDAIDKETLFKEQAKIIGTMILNYNQVPSRLQHGITFWGIGDKNSWIRNQRLDYPLLYDDNYFPKPSYCKLKESI